jgi:hypothetical protein
MKNETVHKGDVGSLSINMYFKGNKISEKLDLTDRMDFKAGNIHTFFITSSDIKEDIQSINVVYNYNLSFLRLKNPEIFVEYVEIQSMEYGTKVMVCPRNGEPLVNGFVSEFKGEFCRF